ncbi:hypothetical protein NC653_015165 [Populus alba x Populus x berolinensis]|uniref:H15 domain-containing protein n=1 Tax=Populus alba x Populus x berolinensis TaxID=444605 RepID=A0AAD6QK16_9ROSI|nr:hypothetical protein NC653_015165 [Populus alba x Populus x berolinensis]
MGNPKQKWTSEEEEALRAGDKWRNMTVSAGSQSVKDKSRTTKVKSFPDSAAATPLPNPQTSAAAAAAADIVIDDYSEAAADSKTAPKYNAMIFKQFSAFNEPNGADTSAIISYIEIYHRDRYLLQHGRMIFVIFVISGNYVVGHDVEYICAVYTVVFIFSRFGLEMDLPSMPHVKSYSCNRRKPIPLKSVSPNMAVHGEQRTNPRQELPQNFRRQLSSRLRRLVAQEKLEKVQNCYKIKKVSSFGTKTPTPKKEVRPKSVHDTGDTVEGAANDAAYSVAEAENKSFLRSQRGFQKMAEDADSLLQLANEILEKCNSSLLLLSMLFHYLLIHALILDLAGLRGEIVIMG